MASSAGEVASASAAKRNCASEGPEAGGGAPLALTDRVMAGQGRTLALPPPSFRSRIPTVI